MRLSDRINGFALRHGLINVFLCVFLFFQPFKPFTGVRNTAFVLMLLFFALKAAKGGVRINLKDPAIAALCLLFATALLSSVVSPYPIESLDSIRKNLLYQLVVFFVITAEHRGKDGLKPVFYSLLGGFAVLSAIIAFRHGGEVFGDWSILPDKRFTSGYATFATFYIPLGLAYIYSEKEDRNVTRLLVFFVALEFFLLVLNNHRAQTAAIVISCAAVTLAARRLRLLAVGAGAVFVIGLVILQAKPDALARYKTLLAPGTYTSNEYTAWNNRLAIWSGTLDMIKERPALGYGYGWKKIDFAAKDMGFLEKWKDARPETYGYFGKGNYGSSNPHNLFLQILFEVGVIGLLAFLSFWVSVAMKAIRARPRGFLRLAVLAVLVSYGLVNIANGLWSEAYGNIMLAFAAICVVLHREEQEGVAGHG